MWGIFNGKGRISPIENRGTFRTCFFNIRTLNLSKSVSDDLFSLRSIFLAHADSAHFASIPSFSQALATALTPAPRGSFGITRWVTIRFANELACLGTEALSFFEGPSTRTYERVSVWTSQSNRAWKTYTLVIDYLNDYCEASNIFTVGKKYNSANLDESPLRGNDFNLCHSTVSLWAVGLVLNFPITFAQKSYS